MHAKTQRMMDEFLFRTTGASSADDKKGEKSREEKEKEQAEKRRTEIEEVKQEHGRTVAEAQAQIQASNPYNFTPSLLVDFNIHNDERYKAYVQTLRPNQMKRYTALMQKRDEHIMKEKKKACPRHNMPYARYQELLRDVQVPAPVPIWLYPYPHFRGETLTPGTPAPWSRNFDLGTHHRRQREEETRRHREQLEREEARSRR